MRDYQPVKNNKYQLDPVLYRLVLAHVRSYPGFKRDIGNHLYLPAHDLELIGSGNSVKAYNGSTVEHQAIVMAEKEAVISAVDAALKTIPDEYRKPILDNIIKSMPYYSYHYASGSTLSRNKSRFLYKLAYELNFI